MPCYYPRAHLGPLLVLLLYRGRDTPYPPPFLITIPLKRLLLSANEPPCPLSLCIYLEDSSKPSFFFLSPLCPLRLLLPPPARDRVSNWPPLISYPLLLGLQRAQRQRTDPDRFSRLLTFLPIKRLALNYSHPTLIVID